MVETIFDTQFWAPVPFHFWSAVMFMLGSMVGSFLNVCIHRMPLGESVVSPPSHCPHCGYSIPWYLNIPLVTWVYLGAKCRNCRTPISARYFLVELLTAGTFLSCWLVFGGQSTVLAIIYAFFLAGLITATFIDFEHFIIPDEITIGGMVVGFVLSFLIPSLHGEISILGGMKGSLVGIGVGTGLVYFVLRVGKLVFGKQKLKLESETKIVFTETALLLPDKSVPYDELFYRDSDAITVYARTVEMLDRCYKDVVLRLTPSSLHIGEEKLDPETVPYLEALTGQVVLPREAMGLGDVKFMGAIGAFLGWKAVVFSLLVSSFIGAIVGITLVALRRRELSSRLPYGPYIALAAAIWIFAGPDLIEWYRSILAGAGGRLPE